MSRSAFYQLYYHLIWTTKSREPLLKETLLDYTQETVVECAKKRNATVIACGVMPDHIHLLVSLPPTVDIASFVGGVKGSSAHHLNQTIGDKQVQWQEGYGALTLRAADVDKVARYVNCQPVIHASRRRPSILESCSPVHGA